MPAAVASSEIDDIFAGSKKTSKAGSSSQTAQPVASSSTKAADSPLAKSLKKKKKKKTLAKPSEGEVPLTEDIAPSKSAPTKTAPPKRVPETVVDPSLAISKAASSANSGFKRRLQPGDENAEEQSNKKPRRMAPIDGDEARFKDSRGSGPRRTTEEGWTIYKEDELGIENEGGDTPFCPFDCDCCF